LFLDEHWADSTPGAQTEKAEVKEERGHFRGAERTEEEIGAIKPGSLRSG
jgi:hypothetical protein